MYQLDWQLVLLCSSLPIISYIGIRVFLITSYLLLRFIKIKLGGKIQIDANKVILVTGATSGLGLCLVKHLHKLGFTILATYYSDQELGYAELRDISLRNEGGIGERIFLISLDVSSRESISACHKIVEQIFEQNKGFKLHALVNNAGCSFDGPFEWSSEACIRRVIDTNLIGCIMMCRQFVNRIIQDKGRFVNVSSGIEIIPTRTMSIYGATKAAVAYFSEALDHDLRPYGAASYCILPGNYISGTNICFTRLSGLQRSINALSEQEKQFYANSINKNLRVLESIVRDRLARMQYNIKDMEKLYNVDLEEINKIRMPIKRYNNKNESAIDAATSHSSKPKSSIMKQIVHWLFYKISAFFSGETSSENLETTGILTAFEASLLLRRSLTRLYLGTPFFTYFAGPIAEILPPLLYRQISPLAYNSILKQNLSLEKRNLSSRRSLCTTDI